ncbi:glyoxalase [Microbacterium oxydans]|uniref:VOC family protein n=1 Tax=Microbacterium sp. B19(2022) TaxID=2914045 RepID=UPI001430452E|nr:VOC family protein [Microbacterium sp. B19(2022)]NJI60771.1 glyoxalase [Microbacterium sp. B19(2022)]
MPGLHHVELWVADLDAVRTEWRWILDRLGFTLDSEWSDGESWAAGGTYLTFTTSPNLSDAAHDRRRAGLNHLAFHGGDSAAVDALMAEAPMHGWLPLYAERYPHAGGEQHYAGWLENAAGFKVEVVADVASTRTQTPATTAV